MPIKSGQREIIIKPEGLGGFIGVPETACGLVIFAHGSGSGRMSPRNNHVARAFREAGLATLLLDLLTEDEARDRHNVFDIGFLTRRLIRAHEWAKERSFASSLPIGFFGASTGAAAALSAAAQLGPSVGAVVSRGGRPDLATEDLPRVEAPTLLLVGSRDTSVIEMNESAYALLETQKRMILVEGASHLFEEPGTLDVVIHHASEWFRRYLCAEPVRYPPREEET